MGKDLERFTTDLPEYLHCAVCLEAAYPPVPYCASEHTLCGECFDKYTDNAGPLPTCPTCRGPARRTFNTYVVSPGLKRAIESYDYECDKRGCSWTGSLTDEAAHTKVCVGRFVCCKYCKKLEQDNEFDLHWHVCPELLIDCPRGGPDCGGKKNGGHMRRRNMEILHDPCCTMYPCMVTPGCTTRTTLANLPDHEAACESLHEALSDAQTLLKKQRLLLRDEQQAHERTKEKLIAKKPPAKKAPFEIAIPPYKQLNELLGPDSDDESDEPRAGPSSLSVEVDESPKRTYKGDLNEE